MRRKQERAGRPTLHLALNGKIICGDCGSTYRRCTSSNGQVVWRCRHDKENRPCDGRSIPEEKVKDAVVIAFNRLPECREDLIRIQERIRWGPLEENSRELEKNRERKEYLENILNKYVETGILDKRETFLFMDKDADTERVSTEAAIECIRDELDQLESQREELLTETASLAVQEVQIHTLLKLIERIKPSPEPPGHTVTMAAHLDKKELQKPNDKEIPGACYTLQDFYDRTDNIEQDGPVEAYDNDMVTRYIKSITVDGTGLRILFKAGAEIRI